jgi:hypothetical protein
LPQDYWDLLSRYQTLERALLTDSPNNRSNGYAAKAAALRLELQQIEAKAGAARPGEPDPGEQSAAVSPLDRAQGLLDSGAVLLSFHLSERMSWLWAADRAHVDVYRLPPLPVIASAVAAFTEALRSRNPDAAALGRNLYAQLFGMVPAS